MSNRTCPGVFGPGPTSKTTCAVCPGCTVTVCDEPVNVTSVMTAMIAFCGSFGSRFVTSALTNTCPVARLQSDDACVQTEIAHAGAAAKIRTNPATIATPAVFQLFIGNPPRSDLPVASCPRDGPGDRCMATRTRSAYGFCASCGMRHTAVR
jgi:hypothetical protein